MSIQNVKWIQIWDRISDHKQNSRELDILYAASMASYMLHYHAKLVAWVRETKAIGNVGAMVFLDAAFLLALLYLAVSVLLRCMKLPALIGLVFFMVVSLRLWPNLEYEVRCRVMNVVLVLAAHGRKQENILKIWLGVFLLTFCVASLGPILGYGFIQPKWQNYPVGYAMGYIHPNNASRMLFWIAMLIWFLYGKKSDRLALICFLPVALISMFYTRCRTIAVLAVITPIWIVLVHRIKKSPSGFFRGLLILTPFLCMAASVILSYAVVPFIPRYRHSVIWNMLSRFVQNNIALREYGVGLREQWIDFLGEISREFYGETIYLRILDNAYVPWLIRNGVPKTILVLGLNSLAIFKAMREHRTELTLLFVVILLYGLMEPASMQMQYNFAFLCLLTEGTREENVAKNC